jgi:hypothetical protein
MNQANHTMPPFEHKLKRGTIRKDGYIFDAYCRFKKGGVLKVQEIWLSPEAWDRRNEKRRQYDRANKAKRTAKMREYRSRRRDHYKRVTQEYQIKNKERLYARQKEWVAANRDKVRATLKRHDQKMRAASPEYRLKKAMRCRIYTALKGIRKMKKTFEFLGCTAQELRQHLESQFEPGMTWQNYGSHWHVDHVFPLAWFDLSDPEHQKKAFGLKNMQPMWAEENSRKRDRFAGK